jgi:hypothetical protein
MSVFLEFQMRFTFSLNSLEPLVVLFLLRILKYTFILVNSDDTMAEYQSSNTVTKVLFFVCAFDWILCYQYIESRVAMTKLLSFKHFN